MKYEKFLDAWHELSREDKINCFNDYAREYYPDDVIYNFDEEFFNTFYANNPMDAVRAAFFGNISNWSDEYIRFNGYANLFSMNEWEAADFADDYVDGLYEHEEIWREYIDDDGEE